MAGGKKKSSTLPSKIQKALSSIWQDKHMVLFKAEYTFLVTAVLWFLEVGINIWVIQKVACKCSNVESIADMILGEVNNSLMEQQTKESPYCLISVCSNGIQLHAVNAVVYSFLYFIHTQLLHLPSKIIVWLSLYLIRRDSLKGTRAQTHCACLSVTHTPYSQNDNMTLHRSMQRDANFKCHRDCSV